MTDVILIATIVAFFVAAALLVRVLDHMIAPPVPTPIPAMRCSRPTRARQAGVSE